MFCDEECRLTCWEESHRFECTLVPQLVACDFSKIELIAIRTLIMATNQYKSLEGLLEEVSRLESVKVNDPRAKGVNENGLYDSADYRTVHYLVGNLELRSNADVFRKAATAAYILHLLDKQTDYFVSACKEAKLLIGGLLFQYLMIVPSNAHEISEMVLRKSDNKVNGESVEVGGALYPVLSLINHSCDPNVVRDSRNGDTNSLTAIKVIAAGEQVKLL